MYISSISFSLSNLIGKRFLQQGHFQRVKEIVIKVSNRMIPTTSIPVLVILKNVVVRLDFSILVNKTTKKFKKIERNKHASAIFRYFLMFLTFRTTITTYLLNIRINQKIVSKAKRKCWSRTILYLQVANLSLPKLKTPLFEETLIPL